MSGVSLTHQLDRIEHKLDALLRGEHRISKEIHHMANELEDLTAKVARVESVDQSAIVLLQGLKAKLDAAGTNGPALKALSDSLGSNTDALAAAVIANTPTEPAPVPAPEPVPEPPAA
jgi:outer membrane murein-binding lipoprotein Lpp